MSVVTPSSAVDGSDIPSPPTVAEPAQLDVLDICDSTAPGVFEALCHLTLGDRRLSESLLVEAYLALYDCPRRPTTLHDTEIWLAMTAHWLYATAARAEPPTTGAVTDSRDWHQLRWAAEMNALAELSSHERTALHLHFIERVPIDDVARCLDLTLFDLTPLVGHARTRVLNSCAGRSLSDVFRATELWLGDETRAAVRTALEQRIEADAATRRGPRTRAGRNAARLGAVAAGVVLALTARAVLSADVGSGTAGIVAPTLPPSTQPAAVAATTADIGRWLQVPAASDVADGRFVVTFADDARLADDSGAEDDATDEGGSVPDAGRVVEVEIDPPVDGSVRTDVMVLATDLTDIQPVALDEIVHYTNGRYGIAWQSPCNRPPQSIRVTQLADAHGISVLTGEFPGTSCVGMTNRWTIVIEPPQPIAPGRLRPLMTTGDVDTSFRNSFLVTGVRAEDPAPGSQARASVADAAGEPWSYGIGCETTVVTTYTSPQGPLFETLTLPAARARQSSGERQACDRLATEGSGGA